MASSPAGGPTLAGYRLLRVVGQGASSKVHLAQHEVSGQVVALKVMPLPEGQALAAAKTQFLAVGQTAAALRHPCIVEVLSYGVQGSTAWLAMEAVAGTDLSRYTRAPRLLPEALVLRCAWRVAQALAHAHQHGVVHRDVKPENVLVNWAADVVKLADFGLARARGAAATGTGLLMGTPAYMAPEQLAGAEPSASTDLYALGVLVFELLTGRLPHEGLSMGQLLQQVAQDAAPDLCTLRPDLPAALGELLARLLSKDPAHRPASARRTAEQLLAFHMSLSAGGPKSR